MTKNNNYLKIEKKTNICQNTNFIIIKTYLYAINYK